MRGKRFHPSPLLYNVMCLIYFGEIIISLMCVLSRIFPAAATNSIWRVHVILIIMRVWRGSAAAPASTGGAATRSATRPCVVQKRESLCLCGGTVAKVWLAPRCVCRRRRCCCCSSLWRPRMCLAVPQESYRDENRMESIKRKVVTVARELVAAPS